MSMIIQLASFHQVNRFVKVMLVFNTHDGQSNNCKVCCCYHRNV